MTPVAASVVEDNQDEDSVEMEIEGKETNELTKRDSKVEAIAKPTIGIIYPPPDVRNIVDKTASFVARNGMEFEERIRQNEAGNSKFNFLNPNDPYYAYYKHKLKEFKENTEAADKVDLLGSIQQMVQSATAQVPPQPSQSQPQLVQVKIGKGIVSLEQLTPKDPPPDFEFTCDPPSINSMDLDIVKLTAQFVARNGRQFLANLMAREQRNYLYDFLKPQHSLFQYFTKLVEQYSKVLVPQSDVISKLRQDNGDYHKILDKVKYRVEWLKYQEREKRKEEDEREKERVAFASIDWHDFVVVETVNFREDETDSLASDGQSLTNLPPPVSMEQLGARILAQERFEQMQDVGDLAPADMEMDEEEEEEHEEEHEEKRDFVPPLPPPSYRDERLADAQPPNTPAPFRPAAPPPPSAVATPAPAAPLTGPSGVVIRTDYDPKAARPAAPTAPPVEKYLISPITGEKLPAEAMAEHMKIILLDPRWKEQKQKAAEEKRKQDEVFAEGVAVGSSLKGFAQYRSDIFGPGTEETVIGRKLGEEEVPKKPDKIAAWDGHTASSAAVTKLAQSNITIDDQIQAIHKSKGLIHMEDMDTIGPFLPKSGSSTGERSLLSGPSYKPPAPPSEKPSLLAPHHPPSLLSTRSIQPPSLLAPSPTTSIPSLLSSTSAISRPVSLVASLSMPMAPTPMSVMQIQIANNLYNPAAPTADEEPVIKKQKVDPESVLVPENLFLAGNPSKLVTFSVTLPDPRDVGEKNDWQLQGQKVTYTMVLTEQVNQLKAKITETTGMPPSKQKLATNGIFMKDNNSLAYYNISSASQVQLMLRERGGRKK